MESLNSLLQELQASQLKENYSQINELLMMSGGVAQLLDNDSDLSETGFEQRQQMAKTLRSAVRNAIEKNEAPSFHPTPVGAADVWGEAMDTLKDSGRGELPPNTLTTVFYGLDPNGWTVSDDAGDILAFDLALVPVLDYLNFSILLAKQRVINTGGLTEDYFRTVIAPYLFYFVLPAKPSSLPSLNPMSRHAYFLVKAATREQLRFVCAHEIGHALLGHNTDEYVTLNLSSECHVNSFARQSEMEFEADAEAFVYWNYFVTTRAVSEQSNYEAQGHPPYETPGSFTHCQTSLELLFTYLGSIELTRELVSEYIGEDIIRSAVSSHPPALERLKRLREYWGPAALDYNQDGRLAEFGQDIFIDAWGNYLKSLGESGIKKLIDELQSTEY